MKLMLKKQEKIDISKRSMKKILGRIQNWNSPCPELVHGFWSRIVSSFHERVRLQLNKCLDSGLVPSWLVRGRTSLLQKDKSKGNIASNYKTYNWFPINVEVIDICSCISDISKLRSTEIVTRRAERVHETF